MMLPLLFLISTTVMKIAKQVTEEINVGLIEGGEASTNVVSKEEATMHEEIENLPEDPATPDEKALTMPPYPLLPIS